MCRALLIVFGVLLCAQHASSQALDVTPVPKGTHKSSEPESKRCAPLPDEIRERIMGAEAMVICDVGQKAEPLESVEDKGFGYVPALMWPDKAYTIRMAPLTASDRTVERVRTLLLSPEAECDWDALCCAPSPQIALRFDGAAGAFSVFLDEAAALWWVEWQGSEGPRWERRRYDPIQDAVKQLVSDMYEDAL